LTSSSSSSPSFSSSSPSTPTPSRQIDNLPSQSSSYPPPTSSPRPPLPHPSRYIPGTRPAITEDEIRTSIEWQFGRDHFECPKDHQGRPGTYAEEYAYRMRARQIAIPASERFERAGGRDDKGRLIDGRGHLIDKEAGLELGRGRYRRRGGRRGRGGHRYNRYRGR